VTLTELNACDQRGFVEAIGWVFEASPWVAERSWRSRPFASLDELHLTMTGEMRAADPAEQLGLLRAHPDLGGRARMSDSSSSEQRSVGLDQMSQAEFERLQALNTAYRSKFGIPFLFAVKGSSVDQILGALQRRLAATPEEEFEEALRQVARIARFRLESVIST
jgi:OHCU decarboxylase